ncbi:hypothetical protein [Streptomyces sp. AM6-12]
MCVKGARSLHEAVADPRPHQGIPSRADRLPFSQAIGERRPGREYQA